MYEKVPEQGEYSYIAGMRVSLTLFGYAANDYYDGPEPVWGLIHGKIAVSSGYVSALLYSLLMC